MFWLECWILLYSTHTSHSIRDTDHRAHLAYCAIYNCSMIVLVAFFLSLALGLLYLYHVDRGMSQVPDEAHRFSPRRWTVDEIKQAYQRNVDSPVNVTEHLPPKQNRRYVIVGGSGITPTPLCECRTWPS